MSKKAAFNDTSGRSWWSEEEIVYLQTVFLPWLTSLTVFKTRSWLMGLEFWNNEAEQRGWLQRSEQGLQHKCSRLYEKELHSDSIDKPISQLFENDQRQRGQPPLPKAESRLQDGATMARWTQEEVYYLMKHIYPWVMNSISSTMFHETRAQVWEEAAEHFNNYGSSQNWPERSVDAIRTKMTRSDNQNQPSNTLKEGDDLQSSRLGLTGPMNVNSQPRKQSPELIGTMARLPTNTGNAEGKDPSNPYASSYLNRNADSSSYASAYHGYSQIEAESSLGRSKQPTSPKCQGFAAYSYSEFSKSIYTQSTITQSYSQQIPYSYKTPSAASQAYASQPYASQPYASQPYASQPYKYQVSSSNPMSLSAILNNPSVSISSWQQQLTTSIYSVQRQPGSEKDSQSNY